MRNLPMKSWTACSKLWGRWKMCSTRLESPQYASSERPIRIWSSAWEPIPAKKRDDTDGILSYISSSKSIEKAFLPDLASFTLTWRPAVGRLGFYTVKQGFWDRSSEQIQIQGGRGCGMDRSKPFFSWFWQRAWPGAGIPSQMSPSQARPRGSLPMNSASVPPWPWAAMPGKVPNRPLDSHRTMIYWGADILKGFKWPDLGCYWEEFELDGTWTKKKMICCTIQPGSRRHVHYCT